jgi:glycosyltransferase involved in cell wall biosynthesis
MPKILHLISSGGLFGAERVVLNLACKSKEITSFVGAINNLHNPHLEIIEEAKKLGLKTIVFESKGKFDFGTITAIKKFIIENKIDIVHTHNYKADIAGFGATRSTSAKWVVTNHLWHSTNQKLRFYEFIDAFVSKFASKVVAVSSRIKQDLMRKGLKADRLIVIDNGIPIEKFDRQIRNESMRSSLGIAPGDCAIMIVGRLAVEKGHAVFLKAAAQVVKNVQNVKFVIVGDGPLREELKAQTRHLNLSVYVIFTGILEDMPAVYAIGDIMVNASFAEGLPMTILEAMASRLPVIATDVGAVGEVIKDQETGILIKPGDEHQLALKIIELVKDKEKRQRLTQKAHQEVCTRYSDTRMAERYKEIYFSALKSQ